MVAVTAVYYKIAQTENHLIHKYLFKTLRNAEKFIRICNQIFGQHFILYSVKKCSVNINKYKLHTQIPTRYKRLSSFIYLCIHFNPSEKLIYIYVFEKYLPT